jgi:hypothetical protein
MKQSERKTAEQYLIYLTNGKDKTKDRLLFLYRIFSVVKFFVNLFTLIDKYWLKIIGFFDDYID